MNDRMVVAIDTRTYSGWPVAAGEVVKLLHPKMAPVDMDRDGVLWARVELPTCYAGTVNAFLIRQSCLSPLPTVEALHPT